MPDKVELKVSRMDPLDSYSASALATQLAEALDTACRFDEDSKKYAEEAQKQRDQATKLQKLIKQVNERDKKK